jgi:hypothetical protein
MSDGSKMKLTEEIDKGVRELFITDHEFGRDRMDYGTFDAMPPNLQEWWRERYLRRASDVRRG